MAGSSDSNLSVRCEGGAPGVGPGTSAYTSVNVPPRSMQNRNGRSEDPEVAAVLAASPSPDDATA